MLAQKQASHGTANPASVSSDHQSDPELSRLRKEVKKYRDQLGAYRRKLRNKSREAARAKASRKITRVENRRITHASQMKVRRIAEKHVRAARIAVDAALAVPGNFYLKEKNVIKDAIREMIRKLVCLSVPEEKIDDMIHVVGEGLGCRVVDSVSTRTVSRIIHEGGIAAEMQLVSEIEGAKGLTLSGDGTTVRKRNYESRHATVSVPSYENPDNGFATRFLGISSAPNHTSEMQFRGLQNQVKEMYETYNDSPMGNIAPADASLFATYILGLGTDHAEDQKKLARLILEWKTVTDLTLRGQHYMKAMPASELLPIIMEACNEKIEAAGGIESWEVLPEAEKDKRDKVIYDGLCRRFGESGWEKLSEQEKMDARLFVWAGCCMHKEMNSVKGGARAMGEFWKSAGVDGPIKLMNRDNAAAAAAGPSKAKDRAEEVSEGGAVKLTSLAGAIFNHKDDKKGQQDIYRIFFETRLTYPIRFPDTSNTRFQSHCEASGELIVHLPYYLEFLTLVKDNKEARNFNHMEGNVFKALTDIATLTELCVLALYSLSVSHPYMRSVRVSGVQKNALDLKPLHVEVKVHCNAIIDKPTLLLAPDASHMTGSLDGKLWERPEVFYAIHQLAPSLPHLEPCLVAFFRGALDTWNRFTSEFEENGVISRLSASQKARIHIPATNDHNEGALGSLRVAMRAAPNLSLRKFNSKTMYKTNRTHAFISRRCRTADQKYLREAARKRDAAGIERKKRVLEIDHMKKVQDLKLKQDVVTKKKKDDRERVLDALEIELDIGSLKQGKTSSGKNLTVDQIRLQINWHRRHDKNILSKTLISKMTKADALTQLIVAVTRYKSTAHTESASDCRLSPRESPEPLDWEAVDDRDDADLEE
ncbi:hypothetical protein FPV67DRAFT_1426248 [Lyophyllum atratum]|nr:hypothetical protein FPV67DRAFT_1426248 [Lyophyllum atratum]